MAGFGSMGELISAAHANLDALSDRDISAFWTEVHKFLRRRSGSLTEGNPNAAVQLEMILCHTLEAMQSKIDSFSPRDLAQTAIAVAKITKRIEDQVEGQRGRSPKDSPFTLLHGLFIGKDSQSKQFIMQELALAAMPMREEFDARSLSNVIYAFGLANLESFRPQALSNMLWAFATAGESHPELFKRVADHIVTLDLQSFNPQDLANTVWAYATANESHPKLFEGVAEHIVTLDLQSFDEQALANIVWAYATAKESHPKLFERVAEHIEHIETLDLRPFKPQALSNIVWAFSTAGQSHPKLFKRVADHIVSLDLQSFNGQALSNMMWAYATAKESHPKLFKRMADHIVSRDILSTFNPQNFSNTVWAYATAKESHPKLFKKVGDDIAARDSLESFWPQALSNILWAYATAEESHPKLFKRVADHVVTLDLGSFREQALANTLWAYATAKESHPALFKRVADHIVSLDLRSFNGQDFSNTVWAYATANESHPKMFNRVSDAAIQRNDEFNEPQHVANLLWSFATSGQMDSHLFQSFAPTVATLLDQHTEQGLSNLAWAYTVANVDAPTLFSEAFTSACIEKEREFILENLTQLHQWNLWQQELKSNIRLPPSLEKRCHDAFVSEEPTPSALQDDVVSELSSMGLNPEEEFLTARGYRLDALVEVNGGKVGVEVDGPSHFVGGNPNGKTCLKRRQVVALDGIPIVSVPYWEWDKLGRPGRNSEKKQHYLRSLLKLN